MLSENGSRRDFSADVDEECPIFSSLEALCGLVGAGGNGNSPDRFRHR